MTLTPTIDIGRAAGFASTTDLLPLHNVPLHGLGDPDPLQPIWWWIIDVVFFFRMGSVYLHRFEDYRRCHEISKTRKEQGCALKHLSLCLPHYENVEDMADTDLGALREVVETVDLDPKGPQEYDFSNNVEW